MKTKIGTLAPVWHGVLMAAVLAALTACQSSALPPPPLLWANTLEESAPIQKEQKERTETAATLAPVAGATASQSSASSPLPLLLANTLEESVPIQKEQKERTEAAAALAPVAGASAPQASASDPAASRDYAVLWLRPLQGRDENDGVEVIDHGWWRGVQLVVTSKSGAGEVDVQPTGTVWPRQVQVQFQYASGKPFDELERLYLQVPDAWPGDPKTDLISSDNFVVWQRDGAMRVELPAGWLQDRQTLHMAWADRLAPTLILPRPPKIVTPAP